MRIRKSLKTSFLAAVAGCHMSVGSLFAAQENPGRVSTWDQSSMPIVYYVNAEDAASWPEGVAAIIRSFMSWERIPGAYVRFQCAGTTAIKMAYDDGQNVVSWVKEGWPYGSDTIALAVLWVSRDHPRIVGADILLNGENYVWATDGDSQAVDVQDVITHEIGHALGLAHSLTSPEVTMFPVMVPGETKKRFLSEEERSIIKFIYPSGITAVVTYAFSGRNAGLLAEAVAADYPSPPESGRIFLLTRVDRDGNGLDEIGTLQEENGRLAFYLFPAVTSDVPASEPLSYDEWAIPRGDILDLTAVDMDGDGWQEIAVLRVESDGTYALYIYNAPIPSDFTEEDAPLLALRQTLRTEPGDNVIAAMGLDYDGDGIGEIGAVRLTASGQYFFDVHSVGVQDDEPGDVVVSIPLGSAFAFVDMDALDVDGDREWELIALSKDNRGWYVSAWQLPDPNIPMPEGPRATLFATTPVAVPPGQRPMRISSLRIADAEGVPRPAICILMGESL